MADAKNKNNQKASADTGKDRREFLKIVAFASAWTTMPLHLFPMNTWTNFPLTRAKDHFSLNKIYPAVDSMLLPDGLPFFDEEMPYQSEYSIFSLGYDLFRKEGKILFEQEVRGDSTISKTIVERNSSESGLNGYYSQECIHRWSNGLPQLMQWKWKAKMAENFWGKPFKYTGLEGNGHIKAGKIFTNVSSNRQEEKHTDSALIKWGIIGVLPRLHKKISLCFNWIDEIEQVFPGHLIAPGEEIKVTLADKQILLRSFVHTGHGIVPSVYWLNEYNVVMIVVSGTEVLMLDKFNKRQIEYKIPNGKIKREPA